jgi:hypothetical protein
LVEGFFAGGILEVFSLGYQYGKVLPSRAIIATNSCAPELRELSGRLQSRAGGPQYTHTPVGLLLLIVLAGAAGTFLGIITVIFKNERTTNRHQLLSNIPGSVALGAVVCVLPGGLLYVMTSNVIITGIGSLISGIVIAWIIEALDH